MVRRNAELAKYTPSTDVDFAAYLKKEYPDVAVATDEANEQVHTSLCAFKKGRNTHLCMCSGYLEPALHVPNPIL